MARALSRLERMARNPRDNWKINDVETVCRENGLICTPPSGGSHYKVSDKAGTFTLMLPAHRRIKAVYIKALVGFVLKMREGQAR